MASLIAPRHPTLLWARNADVAEEVNTEHTNATYLPGFKLNRKVKATADLEEAARHAELLIVGVPTSALRTTLEQAATWIHPWIPIVSLSKGLEQKTLLRMTESWTPSQLMPEPPATPLPQMTLFSIRAPEITPSPPWEASPLKCRPLALFPQTRLPRTVGPSAELET